MTLTELKYVVAVARERHFGKAAEACFVSQPTLSVGVKKLEEELGVQIFERGSSEVSLTPIGAAIAEQAQRVLEQAQAVKEIATRGKNPLSGPLRVGVIYTIGPYLLPKLVRQMIHSHPDMPLLLQENFTHRLLELLRQGEIDVAILAEPFDDTALTVQALYDEPFVTVVPRQHPWRTSDRIDPRRLKEETMLLLGQGHCFRDHVLEVCPELSRFSANAEGIQKTFEGSSIETIRHMVAAGIGVTVLPQLALDPDRDADLLRYIEFEEPAPYRRIVLAWRRSFTRVGAAQALGAAILACELPGITRLDRAGSEVV